jgi:hypothetical protein
MTALLALVEPPAPAQAAHAIDAAPLVQACRVMHEEDPSVSLAQCLGFVQASAVSQESDWVPPFCRALAYYDPELFYSVYANVADCVVHNHQD